MRLPALTACAALVLLAAHAHAHSPPDGGAAPAVVQWEDYCAREGETDPVCQKASDLPGSTVAWGALKRVNAKVNGISYADDLKTYGVPDHWSAKMDAEKAGDCDDAVLTKRRLLMDSGVSAATVFPAICTTPLTAAHIVLLVSRGDSLLILNNETAEIEKWRPGGITGRDCIWHSWLDPVTGEWRAFGDE